MLLALSFQMIVEAMILSLPMLADVLFLALFFFAIFGIACTELFMGTLSYRCAAPDFTYAYNETGSSVLLVGQGAGHQGEACQHTCVGGSDRTAADGPGSP